MAAQSGEGPGGGTMRGDQQLQNCLRVWPVVFVEGQGAAIVVVALR